MATVKRGGRTGRPKLARPEPVMLGIRVPPDLIDALDREVERIAAERPGARTSRSDAVREILYRALTPPPSKGSK